MSTPKFDEGQEIVFGIDDGSFTESGFLHGQIVRIVEARYGKGVVPAQYQDPKKPIPDRIVGKFKLAIKKQDGTEKLLEKPQEYSFGLPWDGDSATVSPDGKKLLAKKGYKGFSKQTDGYHLLESAINAGFPQDGFKGDLSVFDNLVFQIVSEKNPRSGENAKPKPFFGHLLGGTEATATPATTTIQSAAPVIDGALLANAVLALSTMVSENGGSVVRRDVASKVTPIADAQKWDLQTRTDVMKALFDLPKLQVIAAAAGLKVSGETVSA